MQIDSMNVPTAEIIHEICAEDEKNSQAIANVYSELITNTAFYNDIQEKCGIEGNVNQLISVMGMEQTENAKQHFLKVIVINSDKELCQTMAQEAIIYVQRLHSEIKENVGIHDIKIISQSLAGWYFTYAIAYCITNINRQFISIGLQLISRKAIWILALHALAFKGIN